MVKCEVTGKTQLTATCTDLIGPNDTKALSVKNAWYSESLRQVSLLGIEVVYKDGTTQKCKGNYKPTATDKSVLAAKEKKENKDVAIGLAAFGFWVISSELGGLLLDSTITGTLVGTLLTILIFSSIFGILHLKNRKK